jgi:hypothetical protein
MNIYQLEAGVPSTAQKATTIRPTSRDQDLRLLDEEARAIATRCFLS